MAEESDSVFHSINPATGEKVGRFETHTDSILQEILSEATTAQKIWSKTTFEGRSRVFQRLANLLRQQKDKFAGLITSEMGKPIRQAEGELEKCAWLCDFYAENAEAFLNNEERSTDASRSYVRFLPLGVILAIMPWNYPFWQVLRFAVPALMAGNAALLKHAPNVTGCALELERLFKECEVEPGCFRTIIARHDQVPALIEDPRVRGVTLTGSVRAGRTIASQAGRSIKKTVLELGGSDPFIVLDDAPLEETIDTAVQARFQNSGQSCIAAKRFLISSKIFPDFRDRFLEKVKNLKVQDPADHATDVGPLAREDLREAIHEQVTASLSRGAQALTGGAPIDGPGFFYRPTVLVNATEEMAVCREEVFGPVATLIRVDSEDQAIEVANRTQFGLGSTIWTSDPERAERLSREIEAGQVFINGMVASDPRLPFGGVKQSGYGRELSGEGIREFVNIQTVWIGG